MGSIERLDAKLAKAKRNADYQKRRYWRERNLTIEYLGGKCGYCEGTSIDNLEIHHVNPLLSSVKRTGLPREGRSGEARIRDWRLIRAGKLEAKLVCHKCHYEIEHHGNTEVLKKVKSDATGSGRAA